MHDEIIGFIFILSLVCLIVGSIHAGFLKRAYPNKKGYIWGYFVGYSSALLGGLPLLALLIAAPSDTKIEVSIIFGLLWCCAMLASGIGIIKRKRWAWITRICIWPNPLSIIINSIYYVNRANEFLEEKTLNSPKEYNNVNNNFRTHYNNLKVARDAPPEVITMAYKALVKKYHPDSNNGSSSANETMKIINHSYKILIDPIKKAEHDKWIKEREEGKHGTNEYSRNYSKAPPKEKSYPNEGKVVIACIGALLVLLLIYFSYNTSEQDSSDRPDYFKALDADNNQSATNQTNPLAYTSHQSTSLENNNNEEIVKMPLEEILAKGGVPINDVPILDESYQPPVLDNTYPTSSQEEDIPTMTREEVIAAGGTIIEEEPQVQEKEITFEDMYEKSLNDFFNSYIKTVASNNPLNLAKYLAPFVKYSYANNKSGVTSREQMVADFVKLSSEYPRRKYFNKKIISITPIFPQGVRVTPELRKVPPGVVIKYTFDYHYEGKATRLGTAIVDLTVENSIYWQTDGTISPADVWSPEELRLMKDIPHFPIWRITGYNEIVSRKM